MALGGLIGRLRWKGKAPPPGDRPIWAGQVFVPAEAGATAMNQAADAALRGDHKSACQFYGQARLAMGAGAEAWTLAAASHVARHEMGTAVTLLKEARSLFLNDPKPSHDLAVLEERREDWPAAERHWRDFIALDETKWWAFARLANAVRRQGDSTQADAVLQRVRKQLPNSSELAAETARLHQAEGRPAEALEAWHLIVAQFPQDWTGYHGVMTTLLDLGRLGDVTLFVASHAVAFGESAEAQVDIAQLAERNADWQTAEAAWTRAVALGQSNDWAYRGLIRALRELGRSREADNAAERAMARHPGNASLLADVAESLEARGDYSRAAEVWHSAAALMPLESGYQVREAACLKSAGMRVPIATPAELESAPGTQSVTGGQDSGPAIASAGELDAAIVDDRTLMLQFESLGGTGHGCEFGIFQRRFGAEPLGLLRWADLDPDQLSNALETNLDGIGEPENTIVFIPENSEPAEYWTRDLRHHMAMRCCVLARDVSPDRMAMQVSQRLRFLRSKLLDDLAAGEKIFVYRNMKRNLMDVELARLYAACRKHGDITLLYIRYANPDNPNRTVVAAGPGLLVAFIDNFSHASGTDESLGVAHDDLLAVCRTAYAMLRHGRLAQPASRLATQDDLEIPPDETDEAAVRKRIAAARLVRDAGDLAQAMDILARARAELGWHPDLAIESGWAAQIAGRLQEAAEWWTVVRENTPHHVVGYVNGAQVAVGLEQLDEAERLLALGAERLPGRPDLLAEHAALATSRQDWPEASRRSLLVIDLDPDQWPAWLSAARALRHQSLFDDADALLDRAAQRFAPDQDLLTERCWVAHVGGDWPEADRRWAALREQYPAAPDGWVNGARALRELGRYDDAEDLLLHAAAANLDGQSAQWELAWLATLRGDWPVAAARWRAVRTADPGNVVSWHREATALAAMGETSAASTLSHQGLARFPGAVADAPDLARLAGLDREPI